MAMANESDAPYGEAVMSIARVFDAPRDLVFQAWVDPRHMAKWWGPRGFTNPECELDARAGGDIWIVMRDPTGVDYPMSGTFHEVVAPERLVFAKRVPPGDHLARHAAADVLLDTLPYNAHTTAIDALWMGVPVVTRPGHAFAARVAASLLQALAVPDLITATENDYEELAVALALDPARLAGVKAKIARNRATAPLFDTLAFTRGMETAFARMYERHHTGLAPDHIAVGGT